MYIYTSKINLETIFFLIQFSFFNFSIKMSTSLYIICTNEVYNVFFPTLIKGVGCGRLCCLRCTLCLPQKKKKKCICCE